MQAQTNPATTAPRLLINYTYSVHDSLFVRSASTNSSSYLAFSGFNFFNGPTFFSLERLLTVPRTIYSPASNNWRTMWLARKPLAPVTKTRAMDVVSWAKFECLIYCRNFCAVYKRGVTPCPNLLLKSTLHVMNWTISANNLIGWLRHMDNRLALIIYDGDFTGNTYNAKALPPEIAKEKNCHITVKEAFFST